MTGTSPFPTEYVDREDPEYWKVPWYQFIFMPGKDGSNWQDFIDRAEDLNSALEVKSLLESVPHVSAEGRELTAEFLKDVVSEIISQNDAEWVAGCDGIFIIHHPGKQRKLVSAMSTLLLSPRNGGRTKMLSVNHAGRLYSFDIHLQPNDYVAQDGLIFGLINAADPAAVRLVEKDRGGIFGLTSLYGGKQTMENFAFYSLCADLSHHLEIPAKNMDGKYEPLGESTYPDFEMSIEGREWAVEVARIESGMTYYVPVGKRLDQKKLNEASQRYITAERVSEALRDEISQKTRLRAKCPRYSRHCLLLVDVVNSVGDKGSSVWDGCDLSAFDVVALVRMDGSVDYIEGDRAF